MVTRSIGVTILMFVAPKYLGALKVKADPAFLPAAGGVVGFLSGLVDSVDPPGVTIFLSLRLLDNPMDGRPTREIR